MASSLIHAVAMLHAQPLGPRMAESFFFPSLLCVHPPLLACCFDQHTRPGQSLPKNFGTGGRASPPHLSWWWGSGSALILAGWGLG